MAVSDVRMTDLFNVDKGVVAPRVPHIMEFATSPEYLGCKLFPRQATILKTIFLAIGNKDQPQYEDLFTEYDHEVLKGWAQSFTETEYLGVQPDIYERIRICQEQGRPWFKDVLAIIGRRGGKGYIGAIACAYIIWTFLGMRDPQTSFGIDPANDLEVLVFAGKKDQAIAHQWGDIVKRIRSSQCFDEWTSESIRERMTILTVPDRAKRDRWAERGIRTTIDPASIKILPKESTPVSGRGGSSFCIFFDEMAHVVKAVAKEDAGVVYEAARPSLDQFGVYGFFYAGSSPWQKAGRFYELAEEALKRTDQDRPLFPHRVMFQLTSWDVYEDWQIAHTIPMWKATPEEELNGVEIPTFGPFGKGIIELDDEMRAEEDANPDTFAVERRSRWASVLKQYLSEKRVNAIFNPWRGHKLEMHRTGILSLVYKGHADPSKSGNNFGVAIAHIDNIERVFEDKPPEIEPHVVFDYIHHWNPADFTDHEVDYEEIEDELWELIKDFKPDNFTFDQYNSAGFIQNLKKRIAKEHELFPKRPSISEKTFTYQDNWAMAETFKHAIGRGLVHAPEYAQAKLELLFLSEVRKNVVQAPTSGPVQTDDVADCMFVVVHDLIGKHISALLSKTLLTDPVVGLPGGTDPRSASSQEEKFAALSRSYQRREQRMQMMPRRRR